jgi:hypothetical protein
MIRRVVIPLLGAAAFVLAGTRTASAQPVIPGSTAFCLYEIPGDEAGKRRWINLGIVQYVETTRTEVKIAYGAGGLGSGHEAKIPVASVEESAAVLEKMRRVAAACR